MIGLLTTTSIPLALGTPVLKTQNTTLNGDYNLVVSIRSDRRISQHVYTEGVTALFQINVMNEGPAASDACTVSGTITRVGGKNHGQEVPFSLPLESLTMGEGLGELVAGSCNNNGTLFGVFIIRATVDSHDADQGDNTASFTYISLTIPRRF